MALKQVELVRRRVVSGMSNELVRIRSWLSCTEGNADSVDLLRGEQGEALVADLTEFIMLHLGHATEVTRMHDGKNGSASQSRKAARGAL
jgi:hypothetical protein